CAAQVRPAHGHAPQRPPALRRRDRCNRRQRRRGGAAVRARRAGRAAMNLVALLGASALALFREAGGMGLLAWRVFLAGLTLRFDGRELLRNMTKMGVESMPIVLLTAFFTGGIMVIQSGIFVRRFGAYGLLGFGAGYATLREVGPILIGLMFSGRVGANNAAE